MCDKHPASAMPSEPPRPVFFLTHPRTASNLVMYMLQDHPGLGTIEYPFIDTYYFGQEALTLRENARMNDAKKRMQTDNALFQTYQEAFDQLEKSIDNVQAMHKTPFIKEHVLAIMKPEVIRTHLKRELQARQSTPRVVERSGVTEDNASEPAGVAHDDDNPTILPTRFLHRTKPVFLIRHPALVFESILRVSGPTMGARVEDDEFAGVEASFRWTRLVYDWFTTFSNADAAGPVILNAYDVVQNPAVVSSLCEQLQLDPAGVRFEWDAVAPSAIEAQTPYHQFFFSTIEGSSGVRRDMHFPNEEEGIDLDAMAAKWEQTYGGMVSAALKILVEAAMPDYLYLSSLAFRVR